MRKKLYNIFHPNIKLVSGGAFFIILSLLYLIFFKRFRKFESYPIYLIQSYFLIIITIKVYEILKFKINKIIEKNKYLKLYRDDSKLRYKVSLISSLSLNVIYVLFKFITGIFYKSLWLISFAIYYLILVITRLNLIKEEFKKNKTIKDEYLQYRKSAITLLFINVFLTIIILIIVNQDIIISYNQIVTISIAVYTFYLLISSIVNLFKYRKLKSPLISASKVVNVITSLISILSLEIAMLGTFGAEKEMFNELMIMATGGGICTIIIFISLYMIIKSTEYLNNE